MLTRKGITMKIKRSDVAAWLDVQPDQVDMMFEDARNEHATVFGELSPAVQAVLKNAPNKCVQIYAREWLPLNSDILGHLAYRLDPACVLVEDSRWVEKDVQEANKEYRVVVDGFPLALTFVPTRTGYVCVKVRDADDLEWYVESWTGRYATCATFESIEELVEGPVSIKATRQTLIPVAVVFERGE